MGSGSVLVPSIWRKGVDKKLDGPGPNQKGPKLLLFVRLMVGDTRDLQPASDAGGNMWELGAGLWL
jgi:hypothetical protein